MLSNECSRPGIWAVLLAVIEQCDHIVAWRLPCCKGAHDLKEGGHAAAVVARAGPSPD